MIGGLGDDTGVVERCHRYVVTENLNEILAIQVWL